MPVNQTSGNLTTDAFGGGAAAVVKYIEDYFSTYLYTGTNASKTITNNIDLSTKGGLVWIKDRTNANDHLLYDTVRGAGSLLSSDSTGAAITYSTAYDLASFTTTGFTLGANGYGANVSSANEVSWSFAKAPKFFDVVTYTGTGSAQTINHNLGSAPGSIIIKQTSGAGGTWWVWHTATNTYVYRLNTTDSQIAWGTLFNGVQPTSTSFQVGANGNSNANGETYVAYIFAHNAGGFGLTGTDNVISCGSFTSTSGGTASITLGYEPQWVMIKCTSTSDSWYITDTTRGMPASPATTSPYLVPNTSAAEASWGAVNGVNATGWSTAGLPSSATFIYIAIRRGPMAVPTDATKVFKPVTRAGTSANATVSGVGFSPDMCLTGTRDNGAYDTIFDRLRGLTRAIFTPTTTAEDGSFTNSITSFTMDGMTLGADTAGSFSDVVNGSGANYVYWLMKRAPSFFDEVCYTGNGSTQTIAHNLGAVPELILGKNCTTSGNNFPATFNFTSTNSSYAFINTTSAGGNDIYANVGVMTAQPTSTNIYLSNSGSMNTSGNAQVAYLFASCPNVSKVGTYTGNGTTQTINCGFTGGARFVLIKCTSATSGWYVYDTARGMTTLTDPYLFLNSTATEVATLGSVTTVSTGFALNSTILAAINISSATYIFLAIA